MRPSLHYLKLARRRIAPLSAILLVSQYNAETYFSTEQPPPRQDARFSETHEDGRWPRRALAPPRAGPQEADCQLGEVVRITSDCSAGAPALANRKESGEPKSGFPKSVRLLRSSDFRKVYDHGVRYSCPLFAAFCLAETGNDGRAWASRHRKLSAMPSNEIESAAVSAKQPAWNWRH